MNETCLALLEKLPKRTAAEWGEEIAVGDHGRFAEARCRAQFKEKLAAHGVVFERPAGPFGQVDCVVSGEGGGVSAHRKRCCAAKRVTAGENTGCNAL